MRGRSYLLGESLGSGPACALAAREPQRVAGVCLVTPFARLADVAAHHYPFLPVRWLLARPLGQCRRARRLIAAASPMRLAARGRNHPRRARPRLFDGFAGPKRLWVEPGAHHNGLDFDAANPLWREASDFLLGTRALTAAATPTARGVIGPTRRSPTLAALRAGPRCMMRRA